MEFVPGSARNLSGRDIGGMNAGQQAIEVDKIARPDKDADFDLVVRFMDSMKVSSMLV